MASSFSTAGDPFERVHDELGGDAWLIGRVTGQEFAKGQPYPTATSETFPRDPWFASRDEKAYGVVLDAHGKIAWGRADIGGDPIVVVLADEVSDAQLAGPRGERVSYVFAGQSQIDLGLTLEILNRELGIYCLRAEGRPTAPFCACQGPVLADNIRRLATGERLRGHAPQRETPYLVSTGERHAIGTRNGFVVEGDWVWRFKD